MIAVPNWLVYEITAGQADKDQLKLDWSEGLLSN